MTMKPSVPGRDQSASGNVSRTSLAVAAHRARETERARALFSDPFAAHLAGSVGAATAAELARLSGLPVRADVPSMFAVRTRWYDDQLEEATAAGIRQVAILGAGMDTRAYRLDWPPGTQVFEVDRPATFAYKEPILDELAARPRCMRHVVRADLSGDWRGELTAAGFDHDRTTGWLVEGLIYYLEPADADDLLDQLATCAAGSRLIIDVAPTLMRDLPGLEPWRRALETVGEPFRSFEDDGVVELERRGWTATASSIADTARDHGYDLGEAGSLGARRLLSGRRRDGS